MSNTKARGTYTVKKWEEVTIDQISPSTKTTKVSAEFVFSGEIEGTGMVEYLMYYRHADSTDPHKSSASYVGLIRFNGTLIGKQGGFVLEDKGSFEAGAASSTLQIVRESGTGSLVGARGTGMYRADSTECRIELDFDLQ
jgi:hypothetical protein